MNCDGLVEVGDVNAFQAALMGRAYYESLYPNCNWLNADINGDGNVDLGDVNPFVALVAAGGNAALAQTLTWDAENRLVRVEPTPGQYSPPPDGARTVEFGYDYLGRRVQKRVWTRQSGEWVLTDVRKFVWSGWLMLVELEGDTGDPPVDTVVRKYTWGLDLAGLNGAVGQGSAVGQGAALPSTNAGLPPRRAGSGPALQGAGGPFP